MRHAYESTAPRLYAAGCVMWSLGPGQVGGRCVERPGIPPYLRTDCWTVVFKALLHRPSPIRLPPCTCTCHTHTILTYEAMTNALYWLYRLILAGP